MPIPSRRFAVRFFLAPLLCVAALGMAGYAWAQKTSSMATTLYHGAWFDVRYPANFSAAPPSRNKPSESGSDEATFTSPDKRVQFYVFSPQWNGDPAFVKVAPTEKVVNQTGETRKDASKTFTKTVTWITVAAKDKSYTRTWEDTETSLNTRRVFGVKYRAEADFRKYRPQYLAFKQSLKQFGD